MALKITAYVITMVVSLLGNLLICFIVWRNKRMRTTTNFYLVNLAVSCCPQRSCEGYIFTRVCQSFCSQGAAIPACIAGGIPACLTAGGCAIPACLAVGGLLGGGGDPPPESRRLLLRTVHILLECILVFVVNFKKRN